MHYSEATEMYGHNIAVSMMAHCTDDPEEAIAYDYGYPPALCKACLDNPFEYKITMINGEHYLCCGAEPISGLWVHLCFDDHHERIERFAEMYPRGVDIKVEHIVSVQDAPFGS